jgi:hypothetical protein
MSRLVKWPDLLCHYKVVSKSIPSAVRFMGMAPLVVVISPIIYAGSGLRVKRGESTSFVRQPANQLAQNMQIWRKYDLSNTYYS